MDHQAINAATDTAKIINEASALILGLTPMRTDENIFIGKLVDEGPEVKLDMTRSSSESVNAINHPESKAGAMIGNVMTKKTFNRLAPKSIAASSSDLSNSLSRDEIIIVTNDIVKVT